MIENIVSIFIPLFSAFYQTTLEKKKKKKKKKKKVLHFTAAHVQESLLKYRVIRVFFYNGRQNKLSIT